MSKSWNRPPRHGSDKRVLLVEGSIDKDVIDILCHKLQSATPPFTIRHQKGISNLLETLRVDARFDSDKIVGVVADADRDLQSRWDEVVRRLDIRSDLIPKSPMQRGVIVDTKPRIGIWIMRNNRELGELEDFIIEMIETNDKVLGNARRYVRQVRNITSVKLESKAVLYSWLAVRDRPSSIREAIKNDELDYTTEASRNFVKWIENLFG